MDRGQGTALGGLFPPSLQTQAAHIKGSREPLFLYPLFRKHRYNQQDFEAVIKRHTFLNQQLNSSHQSLVESSVLFSCPPCVALGEGQGVPKAPALSPVFMSLQV